jgi:hypothetical protein
LALVYADDFMKSRRFEEPEMSEQSRYHFERDRPDLFASIVGEWLQRVECVGKEKVHYLQRPPK